MEVFFICVPSSEKSAIKNVIVPITEDVPVINTKKSDNALPLFLSSSHLQ